MKEIPMTIFKKITKTAILVLSVVGLSEAVDNCNTYNATMKEDYSRALSNHVLSINLMFVLKEVQEADVSCLLDVTNYATINGVDSLDLSLHKKIADLIIKGPFGDFYVPDLNGNWTCNRAVKYADFYVPYPNGNLTCNWGSKYNGGKKEISTHLGLGVFVNLSKYEAERMVPQMTNYDRLNNRCILLKLTEKLTDNNAGDTFYFLGVHLLEDSSRVEDVFTPLASDLYDLRSRLKAPLLISGDFGREIRKLSQTMLKSKVLSVDEPSLNNGTIVLT